MISEVVEIERMSYGERAVAHSSTGKVLFVTGGVPGDVCEVEITQEKKTFAAARVVKVLQGSSARVQPKCEFARYLRSQTGEATAQATPAAQALNVQTCGGCPWAHISYETQLEEKRNNVVSCLERIAKIPHDAAQALVKPIIPSKHKLAYRNKVEFNARTDNTGKLNIGFMPLDVLEVVGTCGSAQDGMLKTTAAQDVAPENNAKASCDASSATSLICPKRCHIAQKQMSGAARALQGALRFAQGSSNFDIFRVGVRASVRTKSLQVAIWTAPGALARAKVARVVQDALNPTSIVRVMASPGRARKIKGVEVLAGDGFWEEQLAGERFLISAPSFFQVNTAQAENMVRCVLDFLAKDCCCAANNGEYLQGCCDVANHTEEVKYNESQFPDLTGLKIADLYSGAGTFSIPLAIAGAEVVAVESAASSVRDLRRNAEIAQVYIDVCGGDAAREIKNMHALDALVVDPPRAGLDKSMPESIATATPKKIVYVSCNPSTLARDIARLARFGYTLVVAQPIDMFPQTYHVETVVLLSKVQN